MRRTLLIGLVVAALVVFGFIYFALDPSRSDLFPRCVFLSLTGYKCPGCGSQRAIHALLHGCHPVDCPVPVRRGPAHAQPPVVCAPQRPVAHLALPGHGAHLVAAAQYFRLVKRKDHNQLYH